MLDSQSLQNLGDKDYSHKLAPIKLKAMLPSSSVYMNCNEKTFIY